MTVEATEADAPKVAEKTAKDVEKTLRALVERLEQGIQDVLAIARTRSKVYADNAGEQFDTAQKYVSERVQERPLTATMAALGVGLLLGMVLTSGRNR